MTVDLAQAEAARGTDPYVAVAAELRALHEARDWTPEHQERFRDLCELERALRRRRKGVLRGR